MTLPAPFGVAGFCCDRVPQNLGPLLLTDQQRFLEASSVG
jgi:hypothetical protein